MPREGPVGRQHELEQVDAFLDAVPGGLRLLSITGPAGIGKTTIWREGVHRAEERGYLVLSARPTAAEARLSFTGLSDLLRPVGDDAFVALPAVQRRAIGAALLRMEAGSSLVEGRVVSAAVLSLLGQIAQRSRVLLAIDDAQWLDPETAKVLTYALRRLEASSVGLLVSIRTEGDHEADFESGVPPDRCREVRVGPISTAALHEIVKRQLGRVLPRPTLVRIVTASGGNPFYALEIARELDRTGIPGAGARLLVPGKLRALVASRVARLPGRTREALLVASCLPEPTLALVDAEAIVPAEEAGIVRVDERGRIRFGHPLLASAVYESASRPRRLSLHRDLAERVDDPNERARHLGLAASGPDESVAAALDAASQRAAARGASSEAAEMTRRALELTVEPDSEVGIRRAISWARHVLTAGEGPAEAKAVLEARLQNCHDSRLSAELHMELGRLCYDDGDLDRGYTHMLAALERTDDSQFAARAHIEAAWLAETDPTRALRHCDAVLELLDPTSNPGIYSTALLFGAYLRLTVGQGADQDAVERGRRLQEAVNSEDASPVLPLWPALNDDFALARTRHEERLAWSRLVGAEGVTQSMLGHLAELECWTGDWRRADAWAAEGQQLAERIASPTLIPLALYARGYVDAHLGRVQQARAAAEAILQMTTFASSGLRDVRGHHLLGFLALSLQESAEADAHLTLASELLDRIGYREPARYRFQPDHVEAVIAVGDLKRAEALLGRLEERARVFPRPWILATSARCRGLLHAAQGELDEALAAIEEALVQHERLTMPFELGRTLLVKGRIERRAKKKRASAVSLGRALALFAQLPAPLWAEQARAEMTRLGERITRPDQLTASERRVAELAASGLSNREVATLAFLTVKAVEGNLTRAYDKLGIRSRTGLARVLEPGQGKPRT